MQIARLPDLARRVRRTVLVRRRLLAALCAAVAVLAVTRVVSPPDPETVTVLAAGRDLPADHALAGADLVEVPVVAEQAPAGALGRADTEGRRLASPLRRGEALTDVRLVAPSNLAGYPGMVALPVRIPDSGAVALLRVGDHIDLLATDPAEATAARTVASRVPVIALPPAETGEGGGGPAGLGGRLVVVAVSEQEAHHLSADAVRSVLSIVITR